VAAEQIAMLDPAGMDMALAELRQAFATARDDYLARPRRRVVALSGALAEPFAGYLDEWRSVVRRAAAESFLPVAERCGQPAGLRVLVVMNPDGNSQDIRILESSGLRELDEAALGAIGQAGAFSPFPAALRAEADVIEVLATLRFVPGAGVIL
jgi:protein TonB